MVRLSITGKIGVDIRAKPAVDRLKVSPGSASSRKKGTSCPALKVVLCPCDLLKLDRGISAFGTSEKLCFITLGLFDILEALLGCLEFFY